MRLIKSLVGRKGMPSTEPSESLPIGRPRVTPQAWLIELFKRHGLVSTLHDGWVLPNAELPAIRGTWHPGETHGRLDMQVLVRDGVLIDECFAGIGVGVGVGDIGLADGLQNFTINSFHVLLSALRFYVGHVNGDFTFEALKDNEPWAASASALAGLGWTARDAFHSARLFIVLRATVCEARSQD